MNIASVPKEQPKSAPKAANGPYFSSNIMTIKKHERETLKESAEEERQSITNWLVDLGISRLKTDSDLMVYSRELDRIGETITDETKLNKLLDSLEIAKSKLSRFSKGNGKLDIKAKSEQFSEFLEQEGEFDQNGVYRVRKDKFKEKAQRAWQETEESASFFRPFLFLKNLFFNQWKTKVISKYEREINLYFKLKQKIESWREKLQKGKDLAKGGLAALSGAKKILGENPGVLKLVERYQQNARSLIDQFRSGKISSEKFSNLFRSLTSEVAHTGGQKALTAASAGKLPGFTVKTSAQFMIMEVFSRGVIRAVEERRFGAFTDALTDANTWVEAIPGVGSYRSVSRIFNKTDATPLGLKLLDAGMNLVGDAVLVAGIAGSVFSGGTSLAVATATRAGITGLGKSFLQKAARKEVVKQVLKTSAISAGKILANAGKLSLVSVLIHEAFKRFFPDGKIMEYAMKNAGMGLSPAQERAMAMVNE